MEQVLLDQIEQHSIRGNVNRAFNTLKELLELSQGDAAQKGVAYILADLLQWFNEVHVEEAGEIVIISDRVEITLNVTSVKVI